MLTRLNFTLILFGYRCIYSKRGESIVHFGNINYLIIYYMVSQPFGLHILSLFTFWKKVCTLVSKLKTRGIDFNDAGNGVHKQHDPYILYFQFCTIYGYAAVIVIKEGWSFTKM